MQPIESQTNLSLQTHFHVVSLFNFSQNDPSISELACSILFASQEPPLIKRFFLAVWILQNLSKAEKKILPYGLLASEVERWVPWNSHEIKMVSSLISLRRNSPATHHIASAEAFPVRCLTLKERRNLADLILQIEQAFLIPLNFTEGMDFPINENQKIQVNHVLTNYCAALSQIHLQALTSDEVKAVGCLLKRLLGFAPAPGPINTAMKAVLSLHELNTSCIPCQE